MREIQDMAQEIADDMMHFGGEQSEVISELIEITVREEELSVAERRALIEALQDLGVC